MTKWDDLKVKMKRAIETGVMPLSTWGDVEAEGDRLQDEVKTLNNVLELANTANHNLFTSDFARHKLLDAIEQAQTLIHVKEILGK